MQLSEADVLRIARRTSAVLGSRFGIDPDELFGVAWQAANDGAQKERLGYGAVVQRCKWRVLRSLEGSRSTARPRLCQLPKSCTVGVASLRPRNPTAGELWELSRAVWQRWPADTQRWVKKVAVDGYTLDAVAAEERIGRKRIANAIRSVLPDGSRALVELGAARAGKFPKPRKVVTA